MAILISSLTNGRTNRYTDVFPKRPAEVLGFGAWDSGNVELNIRFSSNADEDDLKARDYTLRLQTEDVSKIIGSIFNPNYSLGFFTGGETNTLAERLQASVLPANGLFAERYSYPWERSTFHNKLFVMALNKRHADFQFERFLKDKFDPALVTLDPEKEGE